MFSIPRPILYLYSTLRCDLEYRIEGAWWNTCDKSRVCGQCFEVDQLALTKLSDLVQYALYSLDG